MASRLVLKLSIFFCSLLFIFPTDSFAAAFKMSPATGTFRQGCDSSVNIFIETNGASSNAADIIVEYDPVLIEVTDIVPGNVYQNYFGKVIQNGLLRLTGASFSDYFTSWGTFATIKFKPLVNNSTAYFNIRFTGADQYNSLDSNIADSTTSNDLLTSVQHGFYSFTTGSCPRDTTPPTINFITPQDGQTGIPPSANINFSIADSGAGVNINTVEAVVNGITYLSNNRTINYSGDPRIYTFVLTPTSPLFTNNNNTLLIKVSDLSGNSTQKLILFNQATPQFSICPPAPTCPASQPAITTPFSIPTTIPTPTPSPIADSSSPIVEFISPQAKETINPNSSIIVKITDQNLNPNTIKLTLNGQDFTFNDPQMSLKGDTVVFKPSTSLQPSVEYIFTVFAGDSYNNAISQSIRFRTRTNLTQTIKSALTHPISTTIIFLAVIILSVITWIFKRRHLQKGIVFDQTTYRCLPHSTIKIYNKDNNHLLTATTNQQGVFKFRLPHGHYQFLSSHPSYHEQIISYHLNQSHQDHILIPMQPQPSIIN